MSTTTETPIPNFTTARPRAGGSTGYSPDLEGLLTGASISASSGTGMVRHNFGKTGSSGGVGFGTLPRSRQPIGGAVFNAGVPVAASPVPTQGPVSLNDAYLEYRKRLDAAQAQASAPDTDAPAGPLAASDDSNYSGGLLGRLVAMAGLDPQNPNRFAPPLDNGLRGFYGDDAVQPWALQRSR